MRNQYGRCVQRPKHTLETHLLRKYEADETYCVPTKRNPQHLATMMMGGAADCCVSRFRFSLLPNLFHCLADFGGLLVGGIADGNEGYGFETFGHGYDVVELVDVEVAHPACGKPLLGGCQAEVLNG